MSTNDKFIADLKSKGYVQGDLSTLPSDISDADRRKVEQYEADQANERMKATQGQKPELGKFHVSLNPNQYGFAEKNAQGDDPNSKITKPEKASDQGKVKLKQDKPAPDADPVDNRIKAEPFGGKGDHDGVDGPGGNVLSKDSTKKPAA